MANSEPVNIEFILRENISKGLKEVGKAVGDTDAAQKKASQSLKDEIAKQRQLIREITADVKRLNESWRSAKPGVDKDAIFGDLNAAKKALAEEQNTLLSMQRQQIEMNGEQEESTGGLIATFGKWATGILAAGAALDFLKRIIESTDRTATAFEAAMNAAKTSVDYFFTSIARPDGFDNFISGLKEAWQAGKDFTYKMDEIGELRREYDQKEVELNRKIEEQRRIFYSSDKTALDEKVKAGEEMLRYMEEKSKNEIDIAVKTYEAVADVEKTKNKLSREDLRYGIENYRVVSDIGAKYARLQSALDSYNEKLVVKAFGQTIDAPNKDEIVKQFAGWKAELDAAMAELNQQAVAHGEKDASRFARIFEGLEVSTDKGKQAVSDALKQVGEAENQYYLESNRVYRETENMKDRELQRAAELIKKQEESARIENQIAALKKEMETATGKELTMMAQRLVLLEGELKVRNAIIAAELAIARNEEIKSAGAQNVYAAVQAMAKAIGIDDLYKTKNVSPQSLFEAAKLRKKAADAIKAEKKEQKELNDEQQKQLDKQREHIAMIDQAIFSLAGLVDKYGEALGMTEEQQQVVSDGLKAMSGIARIAQGDIVGGATQIVDALLSQFLKTEEKIQERFLRMQENVEKMINSINVATESLSNIATSNIRITLSTIRAELAQVRKEASWLLDKVSDGYSGPQNFVAGNWGLYFESLLNQFAPLEETVNKLSQMLMGNGLTNDEREAVVALLESYNSLMSELEAITQDFTGTTVNDLSRSLAEAFLAGEDAAEAWGDKVNSIIKNVIIKQMSAELLQKPIQKAIDTLISDTNGGLSVAEADKFKTAIEQLSNSVQPAFEAAAKALGDIGIDMASSSPSKGMTGDIQRVTEDTASALAGNISAIRINMQRMIDQGGDSMSLLQKSLEYQQRTADNTEGMWKVLDKIESRFGRIETDGLRVK